MALKKINKLYYSIGEVSKITNLKQYVLRYWETEFTVLNPSKNSAGNRIYKDKDIALIKYIQNLLYTKKFTIKGAKQHLKDEFNNKENVEVKLFKNNGYIEINILDNGPGLSEVDIDKIFNKGFSKSKGNGIGLFVAMNIIKAYDGDILPKNRVEGGLCMIVKLRIYNK